MSEYENFIGIIFEAFNVIRLIFKNREIILHLSSFLLDHRCQSETDESENFIGIISEAFYVMRLISKNREIEFIT